MYEDNNENYSILKLIVAAIALVLLVLLMQACSVRESRNNQNMTIIKGGFCYDVNTGFIYRESYTGYYDMNTAYSIYYNENGKKCKYNINTGEWVEFDE